MKPSSVCPAGESIVKCKVSSKRPYELHTSHGRNGNMETPISIIENDGNESLSAFELAGRVLENILECQDNPYPTGPKPACFRRIGTELLEEDPDMLFLGSEDHYSATGVNCYTKSRSVESDEGYSDSIEDSTESPNTPLDTYGAHGLPVYGRHHYPSSHSEKSVCNELASITNNAFFSHNKSMANNKVNQKALKYDRIDKTKSKLKVNLKKSIENYSGDSQQIAGMDGICKKLNRINRKRVCGTDEPSTHNESNDEDIDRFKRYFQNLHIGSRPSPSKEIAPRVCHKGSVPEPEDGSTDSIQESHPNCLKGFVYKFEEFREDAEEETLEDKMPEIIEALKYNRIVLVKGDTGCGKTTQIPKLLMSQFGSVVCTQPRRLAAVSIARKVAKDLDCKLGTTVGYSIRFEDVTSKSTRLKFVTDGILLKEISSKRSSKARRHGKSENEASKIADYDLIVIDEAHERTINIDFLLGYLKSILNDTNISTKVLIMSATLNIEKFVEYFDCPTVEIRHRSHKIDHFYLKTPNEEYLGICIQTVIKIVEHNPAGDILVFLTGQEEIERAYYLLSSHFSGDRIMILKLFSAMPADEQDLIFEKGSRKIILSTNVAETSITIENIRFVVDSGKVKAKRRSSDSAVDFLEVIDISKAQAKQRAGRAGRTQPGIVYRIFTPERYSEMIENPIPEILRSNLSSVILSMKSLGIDDIYGFDFIDRPPTSSINSAIQFLYYLKAVDSKGKITKLGCELSRMPLDPEISMSLYAANQIGCVNAVATIAAFLDYQTPFLDLKSDHPRYKQYKSAKSGFVHPRGDFYTFLSIYESWARSEFSHFFLKKNFLSVKTMYQVRNVRAQLLRFFPEKKDRNLDIEKAFCCGFFMNVAKKSEKGYRTIFGNNECYLHPGDGLFKSNPKYVLFFELFCVKREYMNHCLEIEAETLSESVNRTFTFNK